MQKQFGKRRLERSNFHFHLYGMSRVSELAFKKVEIRAKHRLKTYPD